MARCGRLTVASDMEYGFVVNMASSVCHCYAAVVDIKDENHYDFMKVPGGPRRHFPSRAATRMPLLRDTRNPWCMSLNCTN